VRRLKYFARETIISLRRNLLMTLAGILTVTISLLLLGGILLFQNWVDHGTEKWSNGVEFEIFMQPKATEQQIAAVRTELENDKQIRRFNFITKEEALELYQRLTRDNPSLSEDLPADVLPTSFRVAPTDPKLTTQLKNKYNIQPGVDEAKTADEAIDQLITITEFLRYMFLAIALVLVASSLFLIVNTIRLATFARRREIEVMKLVGASNWFVRVPFMAEGLIQGVIGAGLAISGVFGLQYLFTQIETSSGFFGGFYVTTGNAATISTGLLIAGAAIGAAGSAVGLRRFLKV
jgi:cell division transport system permease protein